MKVLLIGINSKYIHTNLAIRYLKVNCSHPTDILEFTIKDSQEKMIEGILSNKPDLIALSVYIWNIEIIKELTLKIRQMNSKIKILLGGPEVSYEFQELLLNNNCDYIIRNEGEIAFNQLISSLVNKTDFSNIPNLSYIYKDKIINHVGCEISNLDSLKNPYKLEDDFKNKIQYIELSRGCPYNCSYCMASLEEKVRFFKLDRVKKDIEYLYAKGAKTFKFLDRTFNLNKSKAFEIYQFIIENDFSNAVFQFEINGDILDEDIMDYLVKHAPENRIRFEIGIQSTNDLVNKSVNRSQKTDKLFDNILKLNNSNIDLHLDLIAGLPYEDYNSFKNTFNESFNLYSKELQLGFLKLLKGTRLYYQTKEFNYTVMDKAPYELVDNMFISKSDLHKIHIAEEMLEIYWNKGFMNRSFKLLTKNLDSPFDFLLDLGNYYLDNDYSFHRYQLFEVFKILEDFLNNDFIYELRYDYLKYSKIKPKIYWENTISKNEILRDFYKVNKSYSIDDLYKYSVVTNYYNDFLICIYKNNTPNIFIHKKN